MDLNHHSQIKLYFDGDCPICNNIVLKRQLTEKGIQLTLVNARTLSTIELNTFYQLGFDLNAGMLIEFDRQYYYGHAALQLLFSLSASSNLMVRWFELSYLTLNQVRFYKLLVKIRLFILRLQGKTEIKHNTNYSN
ncbi:DUF393 domain-containing protein [Parashewanella spongiae]|uniref:DUF393 domain-containing protein n=1 Tax=Parashewanella spongiae TaxID=342950 RepID=A0A3A6U3F7_9GAMM|nr:DCC1-like thiol-disulfide oxidoreductase family protein [Parashewanella spongiae]MCL1077332.1 DCC1-like thiol-disulfide oxidoreductase family protein [Parashewanella spongiae]RJY18581.1 DUF393 domain-containing protein [Parashewanella spongiae]